MLKPTATPASARVPIDVSVASLGRLVGAVGRSGAMPVVTGTGFASIAERGSSLALADLTRRVLPCTGCAVASSRPAR